MDPERAEYGRIFIEITVLVVKLEEVGFAASSFSFSLNFWSLPKKSVPVLNTKFHFSSDL